MNKGMAACKKTQKTFFKTEEQREHLTIYILTTHKNHAPVTLEKRTTSATGALAGMIDLTDLIDLTLDI